ncbi:hypothetical protein CMU23_01540 [Elizabethkingia anophelis]|nr:hypothetical protein [Elizabethkingia anophelis]MDV3830516.1 hypothetical protein [Elizabethkingia anophelis]
MDTLQVLKKLKQIGEFETITFEGETKATATFKNLTLSDSTINSISLNFPTIDYEYSIKVKDNKFALEITDNMLWKMFAKGYEPSKVFFGFDPAFGADRSAISILMRNNMFYDYAFLGKHYTEKKRKSN